MSKPPQNTAEITLDNVESALADLQARHKRHRERMESQRLARVTSRERHHRRWHCRKLTPTHLAY